MLVCGWDSVPAPNTSHTSSLGLLCDWAGAGAGGRKVGLNSGCRGRSQTSWCWQGLGHSHWIGWLKKCVWMKPEWRKQMHFKKLWVFLLSSPGLAQPGLLHHPAGKTSTKQCTSHRYLFTLIFLEGWALQSTQGQKEIFTCPLESKGLGYLSPSYQQHCPGLEYLQLGERRTSKYLWMATKICLSPSFLGMHPHKTLLEHPWL